MSQKLRAERLISIDVSKSKLSKSVSDPNITDQEKITTEKRVWATNPIVCPLVTKDKTPSINNKWWYSILHQNIINLTASVLIHQMMRTISQKLIKRSTKPKCAGNGRRTKPVATVENANSPTVFKRWSTRSTKTPTTSQENAIPSTRRVSVHMVSDANSSTKQLHLRRLLVPPTIKDCWLFLN